MLGLLSLWSGTTLSKEAILETISTARSLCTIPSGFQLSLIMFCGAITVSTLFAGTLWAQQGKAPTNIACKSSSGAVSGLACAKPTQPGNAIGRVNIACKSPKGAFSRLECVDPDLAALDSILGITLQDAKNAASPDSQQSLLKEHLAWIKQRNQRCGLTGMDYAPIAKLLLRKSCLEDAIEARIEDLQNEPEAETISQTSAISQNVMITPIVDSAASVGREGGGLATFKQLHFSAAADGINGTIDCSVPTSNQGEAPHNEKPNSDNSIIKISIEDNANSYHMFENDTWIPFLDNLRNTAYSACVSALKSGRLRNALNEPINGLLDEFEVYSPQGLFMAHCAGENAPWVLQTNMPKARKKVKTELGIQSWVELSQLSRNPYFFKGLQVGMVVKFDHMLSENGAVFARSGAQIFVAGVPANLFESAELVVLAGRVTGNKGVISPSGREALLPALDYAGAYKCDNLCAGF